VNALPESPPPPELVANDRLDPNEWYMVSGSQILTFRDGQVVELLGAEKERVRRWLLR